MSNESPQPSPGQVLRSEFANDPDMGELVGLFVQEMPQRLAKLKSSWTEQDLEDVQRLAHQLKGAGGGYGFPALSSAAAEVEKSLVALSEGSARSSTQELRAKFEELIQLCQRVSV